ncbi:glycosyltransferase family 4 protein [Paenibacillus thermotolerans]|uniref:glycosyltransferase family 4 protein n=1 Tax=Paenibacillus thermotolerans TaxID=3027807 RepID=UPI0023681BE1|nr:MULTISPECIES: glycosyltransferase family 4 protein [unclassified Paenibacillus]
MKIVLISLTDAPSLRKHAVHLAEELMDSHQVHLFGNHLYKKNQEQDNYMLYNFCKTKRPLIEIRTFDLLNLFRIIKRINEINPDIIHFTSTHHPWHNVIAMLFKKKIKIIYSIHDPITQPGEKVTKIQQANVNLIINRLSDHLVVFGKGHKNMLEQKKVYNVSNIRLGEFKQHATKPYEINPEGFVLLYGRIRRYKGIPYFIKTAEYVYKRNKNIKFVLAGSGDISKYYNGPLDLPNLVIMNRFIEDDEIRDLIINSKVVLLPYTFASQSGVIPEVYSYGRPVITTDVGCLSEMVEHGVTGYLVQPEDYISMGERILEIYRNDEKLNNLADASLSKYSREYTPKQMAKELMHIYTNVLGS